MSLGPLPIKRKNVYCWPHGCNIIYINHKAIKGYSKLGNNELIFTNQTKKGIIYKNEFDKMLGKNFINILSEDKTTCTFLNANFYVWGPSSIMDAEEKQLNHLKVDKNKIVTEKF